jgi:YrbI family 3-deoxy-D-manno-octulosonate 8-phosphate phosphatase
MNQLNIDDIDAIVLDFDGVLTDNSVYINESGQELVKCNRSDGLAIDVLRKLKKFVFILSTEKNQVVTARAKKLKIEAIQSVNNKDNELKLIALERKIDLDKVLYIGNDLNDYQVMKICGYSACPSDSHRLIINVSSFKLKSRGGEGVLREVVEDILSLNVLEILYSK